jgi:hypothetical protein
VALMPPMRRVLLLLGDVVFLSMLWGDSETECLLEEVVDDGLDNNDCWRWISVNIEYLLYIGFDYDLQLTRH